MTAVSPYTAPMKLPKRSWSLGLALLSLLAGQQLCTATVHRTLHGEQGAIAFKDGGMKSTDGKVYFSVQPYGLGIVNAQLSVLKGLEAAKRHGYTFVVPPMIQWWAEKDPSYLLILPFSHFYDQQHFQSFADDYGVEITWELPPSRHAACMLQTQLSDKSPQAVNKATHKAWASEYGVICLGGSSTFFTIDGADEPQFWPPDGLRKALKPSEVYEREVEGMLEEVEAQFGTREFVGVHVRVEGDWEQQCRAAQNRTDPSTMLFNNKHQCWVDEGSIAEALERKLKVKPGSLLFVQTTAPLKKLPRLCSKYRCFTRDSVWTDRSDEIPHKQTSLVLSYLTSLLAEHAAAMYGNIHSSYFGELAKRFAAANKPSHHLNPDCPEETGMCP